jgi:hypothetical protein
MKSKTLRKLFIPLVGLLPLAVSGQAKAGSPLPYWTHSHYIHHLVPNTPIWTQSDEAIATWSQGNCTGWRGDMNHLNINGGVYQFYTGYWGNTTYCY